jgi:hypothetical protein
MKVPLLFFLQYFRIFWHGFFIDLFAKPHKMKNKKFILSAFISGAFILSFCGCATDDIVVVKSISMPYSSKIISPDSSECYAGKNVTVCGLIYGYYLNPKINESPAFLDMGATYPNSTFTVLIGDSDAQKFDYDLKYLVDRDVCVTGVVSVYNNKPEMLVADPAQIAIKEYTNR